MSFTLRTAAVILAIWATSCATGTSGARTSTTPTTPGDSAQGPATPTTVNNAAPGTIPVGQEMDVRLRTTLSSDNATVEQRFETTTVVDLLQNGRVLVPAGSVVHGVVTDVDKAGRIDRDGALTLSFDRLSVNGRDREIRATATQVFESRGIRDEVGTAGIGAGVGGVVGGIIGGVQGALLGAVIGAGGAIAATDGKDVTLPAGSIVRIRMDSPVTVS